MGCVLTGQPDQARKSPRPDVLEANETDSGDGVAVVQLGAERGRQMALHHLRVDSKVDQEPPSNRAVHLRQSHRRLAPLYDNRLRAPRRGKRATALFCRPEGLHHFRRSSRSTRRPSRGRASGECRDRRSRMRTRPARRRRSSAPPGTRDGASDGVMYIITTMRR